MYGLSKIGHFLEKIIPFIFIPLIILNFFSGIVSGIWLLIAGYWKILGFSIAGVILTSLILLPILWTPIALTLMKKGKKLYSIIIAALSLLYMTALMTGWCLWIMNKFTQDVDGIMIIPFALWSYSVATTPWTSKMDSIQTNEFEVVLVFFSQLAYAISVILLIFSIPSAIIVSIFIVIMMLSYILQLLMIKAQYHAI